MSADDFFILWSSGNWISEISIGSGMWSKLTEGGGSRSITSIFCCGLTFEHVWPLVVLALEELELLWAIEASRSFMASFLIWWICSWNDKGRSAGGRGVWIERSLRSTAESSLSSLFDFNSLLLTASSAQPAPLLLRCIVEEFTVKSP